jgi:hypothetical protein
MMERLLNLREMIKTGSDEKKTYVSSEHTKFTGVRVFSYDTDGSDETIKRVKTSISTDDHDAVKDICESIKSLISLTYPPDSAIQEAKERLFSMRKARAEAEAAGSAWNPPGRPDGQSITDIARNAMNMSAAYLEDVMEEYERNKKESESEEYVKSLKETVIKDPAFSKMTIENISTDYVLYQRYMMDLLKFQYFFLIRDLVDEVAYFHTKSMTKSTLANGKRFLDSQRLGEY